MNHTITLSSSMSTSVFSAEFSNYLEAFGTSMNLVVKDDFNIHQKKSYIESKLSNFLQFVVFSNATLVSGNSVDWVVTPEENDFLRIVSVSALMFETILRRTAEWVTLDNP